SQNQRLGGMMSGGLGITDILYRASASGIFKEMMSRMLELYRQAYGPDSRQVRDCNGGYWFEPRMAEDLIRNMVAEQPSISVFWNQSLERVETVPLWRTAGASRRVVAIVTRSTTDPSRQARFSAHTFIDATYEGDLAASAGAKFRVGREGRSEFGEEYAGVVYWDWNTMELLPSSTGEGDHRVQAYNYRFTLTNRPHNRAPIPKPDSYDRYLPIYQHIARDVREGRITRIAQVIYFGPLPNDKYDINNMGRYWPSTDHIEENYDYPTASPERRAQIAKDHREYILGMLYYLQNDPELPEGFRRGALQWGLPLDEHPESGHFPEQLYVREARRICGRFIFTEHDARRTPETERAPVHPDSIAVADYPLDSHATRKREPDHPEVLEGFFYQPRITVPSQVPLGVLVPEDLDGILVCCAVSATHVGYGTLRLEPVYIAMGEACGAAADLARRRWMPPCRVPALALQFDLTARGSLLTFFHDLDKTLCEFRAFQFFGTRGFFPTYYADPSGVVDRRTAADWAARAFGLSESAREALYGPTTAEQDADKLTKGELTSMLRRLRELLRRSGGWPGSWVPALTGQQDEPVTRAELCGLLWRMLP
ncbi:MAG: FAD-dependent oxidoreductase, partial [Armatimonadota bacterium]